MRFNFQLKCDRKKGRTLLNKLNLFCVLDRIRVMVEAKGLILNMDLVVLCGL